MPTTTVVAQPKFVLKSMSIWGAIVSVFSMGLQVGGPILDAIGVTSPVQPGDVQVVSDAGSQIISGIGTAIGAALVVWGRFRAGRTAQPVSMTVNANPLTVEVARPPAIPKSSG